MREFVRAVLLAILIGCLTAEVCMSQPLDAGDASLAAAREEIIKGPSEARRVLLAGLAMAQVAFRLETNFNGYENTDNFASDIWANIDSAFDPKHVGLAKEQVESRD